MPNEKIAYIQSIGGASGDMMLGALTDLGLPVDFLETELAKLNLDGYKLEVRQETRCEMRGTYLNPSLIHLLRCRRSTLYSSRWAPYHYKKKHTNESAVANPY